VAYVHRAVGACGGDALVKLKQGMAQPRKLAGRLGLAVIIVVLLSTFSELSEAKGPATVEGFEVGTMAGKLQGVPRVSGGAEFLGIPYAQPPVGELRWREPLPAKPWGGVRDATHFGSPCAQPVLGDWNKHDAAGGMEDCLYLNVITPVWPPKKELPVMFWIHGGSNTGGTASGRLYKDGTLVNHGVLLVTVNYRLGVFGFLAHPELSKETPRHASGNYGLMDQIAALHWVRANISRFGGDPSNITVFGQSAGAEDTSLLMASPLAHGFFQRAITQSGSAMIGQLPRLAAAEKQGINLAGSLHAPINGSAIAYMRGLTEQQVLDGILKTDPDGEESFEPNIDGYVLTRRPLETFEEGQQAGVPLLIGTTTKEFTFDGTTADARKMIRETTGASTDRALALYGLDGDGDGKSDPLYGSAADQWFADLLFRCPATTQAMWQTAAKRPVYQYELQHAIPGQEKQGAIHSTDLPYVFGFYPGTGNLAGSYGPLDNDITSLIETYWTNFAKKGNPNGFGIPSWPEFGETQAYIEITQAGKVVQKTALRQKQCELFRDVLKQRSTVPH
jgi:para-nitrobenzyl esterase